MKLHFKVKASSSNRLLSRILQVLETQRVTIHWFQGTLDNGCAVDFVISSDEDKEHRIKALLSALHDVVQVEVLPA